MVHLPSSTSPLVGTRQITVLVAAFFVALGSGTNYIYSAYSPQLGARLNLSFTQLNIGGLAGNAGVYISGPIWGRIVDSHGPRILFLVSFALLLGGYSGIKHLYDSGLVPSGSTSTLPLLSFYVLVLCNFLTGSGSMGGVIGSLNSTVKTFPDRVRASVTGLVLAGLGLSAFFFTTLSNTLLRSTTSTFLLILALGTSSLILLGFFFVRPIPFLEQASSQSLEDGDDQNESHSGTALLNDDSAKIRYNRIAIDTHGEHSNSVGGVMEASQVSTSTPLNVHGKALLRNLDFWLLFNIHSLLAGTGYTYINNVGSISQSLYAHDNPRYDEAQALRWQAAQVSAISLANFGGRILIGLFSDVAKGRYTIPRSHSLVLVTFLYLISQVVVANVSNISNLWISSALLGLAHGSLSGITPTVVVEWFGLRHFSENWGYICLSPVISANVLSFLFGQSLDAHAGTIVQAYGPPRCLQGRECYVDAIYLTIGASLLAFFLSLWAAWRDSWKTTTSGGNIAGEEVD